MLLPLALAALAPPRTYQLTTTSHVRMNEAEEQNTYHTLARQTLLERRPNNTYRLLIEVLDWRADKPSQQFTRHPDRHLWAAGAHRK